MVNFVSNFVAMATGVNRGSYSPLPLPFSP